MLHAGNPGCRTLFAALGIVVATPLALAAPDADAVRIGNQVKKTSGVVKRLENGDAACYLTLTDERGREFTELGDFDICFQKPPILGKRVSLRYKMESVMADACQGDPDCRKRKTVALVTEARIVKAKAGASATPVNVPGNATDKALPDAAASHCTPGEDIVFACRAGAKVVSVCASKDASPARGYVQYRFGKADAPGPLELTLPVNRVLPAQAASGQSVPFSGGGGAWMRFRKAPFAYVVYTGIGKWGPKGEITEKAGVVVERAGKSVAHLKCRAEPSGFLGPDWFEKAGVQGNGEDFDFPD